MEWVLLAIVVLVVIIAIGGFFIVPQGNSVIIERFGKFSKVCYGGIHYRIPFIDHKRKMMLTKMSGESEKTFSTTMLDLRESVFDASQLDVISKENVKMKIDAVIYYVISDPYKAVYGINDYSSAVKTLCLTALRNIFGDLTLDSALTARSRINQEVFETISEATEPWGIIIRRVEIQQILPPEDLTDVMQKQMMAEREKRAAIAIAEAEKQAQILKAEGLKNAKILEAEAQKAEDLLNAEAQKQKNILEAEGRSQSALLEAEAQRQALLLKAQAESEYILKTKEAEAQGFAKQIEALGNPEVYLKLKSISAAVESAKALSDGQATKIYLPSEKTGLLDSLNILKEVLINNKH